MLCLLDLQTLYLLFHLFFNCIFIVVINLFYFRFQKLYLQNISFLDKLFFIYLFLVIAYDLLVIFIKSLHMLYLLLQKHNLIRPLLQHLYILQSHEAIRRTKVERDGILTILIYCLYRQTLYLIQIWVIICLIHITLAAFWRDAGENNVTARWVIVSRWRPYLTLLSR